MKLLAMETSTRACSVAACVDDHLELRHADTDRDHASLILPMIDECLAGLSLRLEDVDAIGFGCGPGSFTGVRIATSVAHGLAVASGRPLVGVSSLAVVAGAVLADWPDARVLVVQDARMSEVYAGGFALCDGSIENVWPECVTAPQSIPAPQGWRLAGDAWQRVELLGQRAAGYEVHTGHPNARDLLALVAERVRHGETGGVEDAQPQYLRNDVVRQP